MKNKNVSIRKVVQYLNNSEYDGGFWLPNIQRPFVWGQDQIEKLFDSIMREYPISTLLVWRTRSPIRRRKFIDNYRDNLTLSHYQVPEDPGTKLLVLDGQQRLQSLFIALRGSYNKQELFFSVLSGAENNPDDMRYKFKFLAPERAMFPWVNVKKLIFNDVMPNQLSAELLKLANVQLIAREQDLLMNNLWQIKKVFATEEVIGYQELDSIDNPNAYSENDVVEIFIRANSGGTKLGKSDLLFSLLTASWDDADEAMEDLITELNSGGYAFTRDFILKTCLVLLGKGAAYDVRKFRDNYTKQAIVEQWKQISAAISDVRDYLYSKTYIRSDQALPSYLTLIPVIYFRFKFSERWQSVRGIDTYFLRTLLSGAFSGRPDSLIDKCIRHIDKTSAFSVAELFEVIRNDGRNLDLSEETILQSGYGSKTIHLIFNIWYRQFDYQPAFQGNQPQVDHIFPQSVLRSVKGYNPETNRNSLMKYPASVRDQLANCMLLTAAENGAGGKSDVEPAEWFADKHEKYLELHLIPKNPDLWRVDNFEKFIEARKRLILDKLHQLIASSDFLSKSESPEPASVSDRALAVSEIYSIPPEVRPVAENHPLSVCQGVVEDISDAESILLRYCQRIAKPSKYIAGFKTANGRELALERAFREITVWTEFVDHVDSGWEPVRVYEPSQPRNSNLNKKHSPALRLGNKVLVWKLADFEELVDFVNWYSECGLNRTSA